MRRLPLFAVVLVVVLVGAGYGVLAWADSRSAANMASGTTIGGVDVSGLTREEALNKLQRRIGERVGRPAQVRVGGRTFTLTAEEAGVKIDLEGAVNRAFTAGRSGSLPGRAWRELTSGAIDHQEAAPITADAKAVRSFVGRIHAQLARKPVDASLSMTLASVSVKPERPGRRLAGREDLVARLTDAMVSRAGARTFTARMVDVEPKFTRDSIFDANPVAVTVARDSTTVRVFRRGKLEKTYRVAVGEPKYPTPTGQFSVQTKQKNPAWNVPQSEWAGDLAGQVIPGGDPRNPLVARWIGFNGSVGFHGTKSAGSLGSAASHGCIRMSPGDVIDLFERVEVGTPVLVA
jgi:lipoprotein-anchoring transpeptidase ErfK/SrfK